MKRYLLVLIALVVGGCGGFTKQEFLQDNQNADKFIELTNKHDRNSDCDKLGLLYAFSQKQSPTKDDLAEIMPILGLKSVDSTDIDKLYKLDLSVIDKYNCVDNAASLLEEEKQYCRNKYYDEYGWETLVYFPFRLVSFASMITIVGAIPFSMHSCGLESGLHPIMCQKELDCEKYLTESICGKEGCKTNIDKQALKQNVKDKIRTIFPIPTNTDNLLQVFKPSELVSANNAILGVYDDECYDSRLCDVETKIVTKLNVIKVLYDFCRYNIYAPDTECLCFTRDSYQKISYKNLIYIVEKYKIPESKLIELASIIDNCKQKMEKQRVKTEQLRYGEASPKDNSEEIIGNFLIEVIENAAYTHKKTTELRKEMEERDRNK